MTANLYNRVSDHKNKVYPGSFTVKYNCVVLVYCRHFDRIEEAIVEEKRIKGGSRVQKEELINEMNYEWRDLWEDIKNW